MNRRRSPAALAAWVLTLPAVADIVWDGGDVGGLFDDRLNWEMDSAPTPADTAVFPPGISSAAFDGASTTWRLRVQGTTSFDLMFSSSSYTLLSPEESDESLRVHGALTLTGFGDLLSVEAEIDGSAPGSPAMMTLGEGCRWINSGRMDVGSSMGGVGVLHIVDAAEVRSHSATIACCPGTDGLVVIGGGDSTTAEWRIDTVLEVGDDGTALLRVEEGGRLECSDLNLASDGPTVGDLVVSNGGEVETITASIGGDAIAVGTAMILGAGSTWSSELFIVGTGGSGEVTVADGGALLSIAGILGYGAGSTGTVTIQGAASAWECLQDVSVGRHGTGTLNVTSGGTVANSAGLVGVSAGSAGAVTVDGAGSTWTSFSEVIIGGFGSAALSITNDGIGYGVVAYVGAYPGSDATVDVDGPGSLWAILDSVSIGAFGAGVLTVSNGGTVAASEIEIETAGTVSGDGFLDADVHNDGVIAPGDPTGILAVLGDYEQTVSGRLEITLDETGHGQLAIQGQALVGGGTLDIVFAEGYQPEAGQTFTVLTAGSFDPFGPGFSVVNGPVQVSYEPQAVTVTITFTPVEEAAAGAPTIEAIGDLNSDGLVDVVIAIPGAEPGMDGSIQVFLNQGNDEFGWIGLLALPPVTVGLEPAGLAIGLFDADQLLDVAVSLAGEVEDNVLVLAGTGDGMFLAPVPIQVGVEPRGLAAADFTGEGFTDLIVTNAGDDTVQVLVHDGFGGFMPLTAVTVGGRPLAVDPETVDDDKDIDAVVADNDDDTISILLNLGAGDFDTPVTVAVGDAPVDLATGDVDGNGSPDFATANSGDGTVSIVLNDGAGGYGPAIPLVVGANVLSVDLVDLDGDGDPDLAVIADDAVHGPSVQVLENLTPEGGPIVFAPPFAIPIGGDPVFIVHADFNDDGAPDLVTANKVGATGGSVTVLLNAPPPCPTDVTGDGETDVDDLVEVVANWGPCPGADAACPGDVNGDGEVDVDDLIEMVVAWGECD